MIICRLFDENLYHRLVSTVSIFLYSKEYSNKKLPYRRNLRRSLVNEAVEDDDSSSSQQTYMKNVIREVITNGTKQTCNSSSPGFLNKTSISSVVAKLYRLSQRIDKVRAISILW